MMTRGCIRRLALVVLFLIVPLTLVGGGIAGGEARAGADTRPVILALGDSLTAGFGVPAELSYPAQLEQQLERMGYRYRVVNMGVSGSTTTAGLSRLHRGLMLQPEIVILQFGGNDAGRRIPLEVTRENLRTMIDVFRLADAHVILAGRSLPRSGPDAGTLLPGLAAEEGVSVVSGFLMGVAGQPQFLLSDGSHPNGEGYERVVRNVLEVLEPILRETQASR